MKNTIWCFKDSCLQRIQNKKVLNASLHRNYNKVFQTLVPSE